MINHVFYSESESYRPTSQRLGQISISLQGPNQLIDTFYMASSKIFRILRKDFQRFGGSKIFFLTKSLLISMLRYYLHWFFISALADEFLIFVLLYLLDVCLKHTKNGIITPTISTPGKERFIHGKFTCSWPRHYLPKRQGDQTFTIEMTDHDDS